MQRADPDCDAALQQARLNLDQRHVALLGDQAFDKAAMGFDLTRMPVAAARLRHSPASLKRSPPPPDRARRADTKSVRRSTAAQPAVNRCDNPVSKIL
jgi:hypothetical protein